MVLVVTVGCIHELINWKTCQYHYPLIPNKWSCCYPVCIAITLVLQPPCQYYSLAIRFFRSTLETPCKTACFPFTSRCWCCDAGSDRPKLGDLRTNHFVKSVTISAESAEIVVVLPTKPVSLPRRCSARLPGRPAAVSGCSDPHECRAAGAIMLHAHHNFFEQHLAGTLEDVFVAGFIAGSDQP